MTMKTILQLLTTSLAVALNLANLQQIQAMEKIPKPVMAMIFNVVADKTDTYPETLRLVCKGWQKIVDQNISQNKGKAYKDSSPLSQKWLQQQHGVKGHEAAFKIYINGQLFYRPTEGSDEEMVVLNICDLENPFFGSFECGVAGQRLSISTGFRKGKIQANKEKAEIWICPRFLIQKFLPKSASHFHPIMEEWDEMTAPVGILFTSGVWDNLGGYDHCTSFSPSLISSQNLHDTWMMAYEYRSKDENAVSVFQNNFAYMVDAKKFHVHFVS